MLAAGFWGRPATASTGGGPMPLGARAAPPAAFLRFCARRPENCGADARQVAAAKARADADEAGKLAAVLAARFGAAAAPPQAAPLDDPPAASVLDPALWSRVARVNRQVNHALRWVDDAQGAGTADEWSLPLEDGRDWGDCEDFALEKARALAAAGVPPQAFSLAVVQTPEAQGHAVLLVETGSGPKVLDNQTDAIRDWRETPYRWLMRQVPGRPLEWRTIVAEPAAARTLAHGARVPEGA